VVTKISSDGTYRTDRTAPTKARTEAAIGKYNWDWRSKKAPTRSAVLTPKHSPGKRVGSKIPRHMPTQDAMKASSHRTTIARSKPTGTRRGSRNTYVRKPERRPDRIPE
jgi:hypothetical protein